MNNMLVNKKTANINFYLSVSIIIAIVFFHAPYCMANGKVTLTTYYPSPVGIYDRLTLVPQASLPTTCSIGQMMVDQTSGSLNYCHDDGTGHGIWGGLDGVWGNYNYDVYPIKTGSNPNLIVGIGTSTPLFKLTLENDGGILALGSFGSGKILSNFTANNYRNFLWYPRRAAFRVASNGNWNDADIGNYSVGLGLSPAARGTSSMIGGGQNNSALSLGTTVLGGSSNLINTTIAVSSDYSTIAGGAQNTILSQYSSVSGSRNVANGNHNTISGGNCNFTNGVGATVSGGENNNSQQNITGASLCTAEVNIGSYSTITGGNLNRTSGQYATISGGASSLISGTYSTIQGRGTTNTISGNYSLISGGSNSGITISSNYSVVMGTAATPDRAVWSYETIIGSGSLPGISGLIIGSGNPAGVSFSAIGNVASGMVTSALGQYSWVGGSRQQVSSSRNFVWGINRVAAVTTTNSNNAFIITTGKVGIRQSSPIGYFDILGTATGTEDYFAITSNNTATPGNVFIVKNNGYIGIGNSNPRYPLQIGNTTNSSGQPTGILTTTGNWTEPSSREYKHNIEILNKLKAHDIFAKLTPVTYDSKTYKNISHIGFIAEEVPALVGTPQQDSVDTMGVTAILTAITKEHKKDINTHDQILDELENKLENLDKQISKP